MTPTEQAAQAEQARRHQERVERARGVYGEAARKALAR